MAVLWIIVGALCGLLSLFLRLLGHDYGNFPTSMVAWAVFASVIFLTAKPKRKAMGFIGSTAIVGTLIMVWGMLPVEIIFFLATREALPETTQAAYLSRAVGGGIAGLALYYFEKLVEKKHSTEK